MTDNFAMWFWHEDKVRFIIRIIYRDMFYIFIIITLITILFIFILDNFNELQNMILKKQKDSYDVCFICSSTRDEKEKESINFNNHVNNDHNIYKYLKFMLALQFMDIQDTNANYSYVINCIEKKVISWFPKKNE